MVACMMNNVRDKMANARKFCPGMSEELYAFSEYISKVANDNLAPLGLAVCYCMAMDDVVKGRSGFAKCKEFPIYLIKNKNQVLNQAVFFPQIVDEFADEKFVDEFRKICKKTLGINPPKRLKVEIDGKYPQYVRVAVDWWANAIASPKLDNGEELPGFMAMLAAVSAKPQSKEAVKAFKETLAEEIISELKHQKCCELSVDYAPCEALAKAGEKLDICSMVGYPWKTRMVVSKAKVIVSAGYKADYETLWLA